MRAIGVNVAIIPARGGSKRVPRKNIRPLAGRPIIAWPIQAALESGVFARVVVSTDDPEITAAASAAGAEVPFERPAELADDITPIGAVMRHAIEALHLEMEETHSVCCIYPTAFSLQPQVLIASAELLLETDVDFVFGATRCPGNTARAFTAEAGATRLLVPEFAQTRTQDLPALYLDAGQFCFGRTQAWLEGRPVLGGRSHIVELDGDTAIDIDSIDDWQKAETVARNLDAGRDGHQDESA